MVMVQIPAVELVLAYAIWRHLGGGFYHVALADLEFTMQIRLSSNTERFACLCLLSSELKADSSAPKPGGMGLGNWNISLCTCSSETLQWRLEKESKTKQEPNSRLPEARQMLENSPSLKLHRFFVENEFINLPCSLLHKYKLSLPSLCQILNSH